MKADPQNILIISGVVSEGDGYRVWSDEATGAVQIGGEDVLARISETFNQAESNDPTKVIVGVMDECFNGDLFLEEGWGYSEYTPMDSDVMKVGDHDLIEILTRYIGKTITLVISTEPVNLLGLVEEDPPSEFWRG